MPYRSALLVAPLLLALAPRAQEIAFHPREGSKLAKQFTVKLDLDLGAVTFEVDGQDLSGEIPAEASFGAEVLVEVVDHYVRVKDGKPLELVRAFKRMKGEFHALDEHDSAESPDLDGKELRFLWNEELQRYDVSSIAGKELPEEIAVFGIDMDLRSLLPGKSVSPTESWSVGLQELGAAMFPGLDLEKAPELVLREAKADAEAAEVFALMETEFLPQLEKLGQQLKATCEYAGLREVDGRELAAIQLELDCTGALDMTWLVVMAMEEGAGLEDGDYEVDAATMGVSAKGKGELLWDVAAGHAHGFELTVKLELSPSVRMSGEAEGESFEMNFEAELLGEGRWTMGVE